MPRASWQRAMAKATAGCANCWVSPVESLLTLLLELRPPTPSKDIEGLFFSFSNKNCVYLVLLKFVMHLKFRENKSQHSEKLPSHFLPTQAPRSGSLPEIFYINTSKYI